MLTSIRKLVASFRFRRARLFRDERGQAATEYMMVISVLVVATVFATRPLYDRQGPFLRAFKQFERNVASILADNDSELLPGLGIGN